MASCWKLPAVRALREVVQGFQARSTTAFRRRALEKVKTYSFGLRATRKAGVSVITREHADFVLMVNHLVQELIPHATYNAFAIVVHADVVRHIDAMNHPESLIHMMSWSRGQVWVQAATGTKQHGSNQDMEVGGIGGIEFSLDRGLISIPARSCHAITVEGPLKAKTLVLYTTRRAPSNALRMQLMDLGFPPMMPRNLGRMPQQKRGEAHEQEDEAAANPQLLDDPEGGLFTVDVQRVDIHGRQAARAPVLHVTVMAGALVSDLKEAIRRRLKLNPNKLVLLQWHTVVELPDEAE
eukprot:5010215-Amphidinium_carterae.1